MIRTARSGVSSQATYGFTGDQGTGLGSNAAGYVNLMANGSIIGSGNSTAWSWAANTIITNTSIGVRLAGDLAGTGTVLANAAAVVTEVVNATGADDTVGIRLPATVAGKVIHIYNIHATAGMKVYPPANSAINGGTANAAVVQEGKTLGTYVATNATNWGAAFTANS